jgi:hypothetical protein
VSTVRGRATFFASIPILLLGTTALAGIFQIQDARVFDTLIQKVNAANSDDVSAIRSLAAAHRFDEAQCLNEISHELESLHYELSEISTLIAVSASMDIQSDETTVLGYLRIDMNSTMKFLPLARRDMNNQAAFCGGNALVVSRAQTGLSLLEDSERLLLSLQRRL